MKHVPSYLRILRYTYINENYFKPFLLNCDQLDTRRYNYQTIAKLFNDSMSILQTELVKHENVLLLVSDASLYMIKTGKVLNTFYPKVNELISIIKKIFLKAPSSVEKFKSMYTKI